MRCHFVAEYADATRVCVGNADAPDESAVYRHAASLLRTHVAAHRVVAWTGWTLNAGDYITKATRGVDVESRVKRDAIGRVEVRLDVVRTRETIAAERESHGPECMCSRVCMGTRDDGGETKGDAT